MTAKRQATRQRLLDRALVLFQKKGVQATTMRDIARAAGLSLGAAYYHFPSKDALLFAYYQDNQAQLEALGAAATGTPRERLGTILHGKLVSIRPHRAMLASIVQQLVDPAAPVSAFSKETRDVRRRAIAVFVRALDGTGLDPEVAELVGDALWLLSLALMLVYVTDTSPGERRTHGLVDDALDLLVPLLPLMASPLGKSVAQRLGAALGRAGLVG